MSKIFKMFNKISFENSNENTQDLFSNDSCRYMAILYPLKPRMGKRATLCIAGAIWVVGVFFSIPNYVFYTTYVLDFPNGDQRIICYGEWPDGPTNESQAEYL